VSPRQNAAESKLATAAALYRCRTCGARGDFACETARVNPPREERRGSVTVVVQDFETYYVCAGCAVAETTSDTPPRRIRPLPHHDRALRAQERQRVSTQRAELADAQETFGADWGRP
jgi:hypothetical protein